MATLEEIRAARAADSGKSQLEKIRAARARDTRVSTPDGRSTAPGTTQEQAGRIPAGMVFDPQTGGYVDTALIAERMGKAQGANASFIAGAPFVGEFADEAIGAIDSAVTGRNPEIAAETMRQSREQLQESNPKTATALEIGGGIVGSLPLAGAGGKAADFIAKGGNKLTRGLRAAAVAAPAGAVEGSLQGAGRADPGERSEGAVGGAAFGGGLATFLGPMATLAGEAASSIAKRIKKLDVRAIADEFGLSDPAARTVKNALLNDDLDEAVRRLGQLGDDAMLADSGPATGQLLNAASSTGGRALKVTRDAVSQRSDQIGKRLPGKLDDILGNPVGVKTAARKIASETSAVRKSAYDRAYAMPIDYADDAGRQIEDVLSRVPPKTLKGAIDEANEAMIEAGARNKQIMAEIADDGSVTFREMPNVQQLDEIKKALGSIGRESVDQFGRATSQGVRARRLASDLRDAMAKAVPEYRVALKVGGDKLQRDEALELGKNLMFKRTSVEDVKEFLRGGISEESRAAARQGIRDAIEESMSSVRRTITDPDMDAREAMQVLKEVSSRANKSKLRLVLGNEKANSLLSEMDRAATALTLRAAVARNSDTAIRQSIQGQVAAEATPGLLRRTLGKGGNPLDAAREISETVAGIDPRSMSDVEKGIFDEIADALTRIRGPEARRALFAVQKAMAGQPIKDEQAKLIGNIVAGSTGSLGYQAGQQILAP